MNSNLLLLRDTVTKANLVQLHLSTGNRVNSALDGPVQFFTARNLTNRASDLSGLKDAMGQAISTIKAADKSISSIQSLLDQAKGLTQSAFASLGNSSQDIATRKNLANAFNGVIDQINKLVQDSGYNGKNLLVGSGLRIDASSAGRQAVNSLQGLSGAQITNAKTADAYEVAVEGTGRISASAGDIADAQTQRGISNLQVTGLYSRTSGNFSNVRISVSVGPSNSRVFSVTEGGQTLTQTFTQEEFQAAKAANSKLRVAQTFDSGTSVGFDVDFDDLATVPQTQGIGTSTIEKFVDLRLVVNNKAGTANGSIVVRDGLAPQGLGKLSDGENAFTFDTGTVRLDVNQKTLLQSANLGISAGQTIIGDATGAGATAIVGGPDGAATVTGSFASNAVTNISIKFARGSTGTITAPSTTIPSVARVISITASAFAAVGAPTNTASILYQGQTLSYSNALTRTATQVATGLAQAFNANAVLANAGFTAAASGAGIQITRASGVPTGFAASDFQLTGVGAGNAPSSTSLLTVGAPLQLGATIIGPGAGDQFIATVYNTAYSYTATATDTATTVANNLSSLINAGPDGANVIASVAGVAAGQAQLLLTDDRASAQTLQFSTTTRINGANVVVTVTDGTVSTAQTIGPTAIGNQNLTFSLGANGLSAINLTINAESARKATPVPARSAFGGVPALPGLAAKDARIEIRGFQSSSTQAMATELVETGSTSNDLAVQFNAVNSTFAQVSSIDVRADGQGLQLDRARNGWADRADIDNAVANLTIANTVLRMAASQIATNLQIVRTREAFTTDFSNVLVEGANKLTAADQNEEGANLLTLRTRQQLGTVALSLANQSQQSILRLF